MELINLILSTLFSHLSHGLAIPPEDHLKFSGKVFFYGSEKENHDNSLCAVGEVLNVDGTCNPSSGEPNRNWSFYASATKHGESATTAPRPKMKYDIVVIHPKDKKQEDPIIIPPPLEKNVVVVLRKGSKDKTPKIIEISTHPPLSPEVHFIDYKEGTNMLLPGGIDLKSALAGTPFMANRIKSGIGVSIPANEKPKNQIKNSDGTKISYTSEDAKMKANFERFVRSNMEKNTDKSFKDIVYDYILEANLSDNDPETDQEHPDGAVDITEKTVSSTIQVSNEELKASSALDISKDVVIKSDHEKDIETNIEENAVIKETTAMTPINVAENYHENRGIAVESFTKSFLGEPLTREFSSVWKGISTRRYQEPLEFSTENSIRMSGTDSKLIPAQKTDNLRKETLKNSDSENQFMVQNLSSSFTKKVDANQTNKNHNISLGLISDVEKIKVDKARISDNHPLKSDKIIPEIETFFRELFKGASPELDTKKFDYIIKEMSKIVAESNIFKTQLQKLKKESSESTLSGLPLNDENKNKNRNSSELIKLNHKKEDGKGRIPNWQEPKRSQISNSINKPDQSVHTVKHTKISLSNVLKRNQEKEDAKKRDKNDLLVIPKYSNTRPSSQQIGSSYNHFMSSYLNSYPNLKASNGNSNKDSTTKVIEFEGKIGSISKTFADGWRGMEFTVSSPEKAEEEIKFPNSGQSLAKLKRNYSEITKLKNYETNHNHNNIDSSHGLPSAEIRKPAFLHMIEEGRSHSTGNYGISHDKYDHSHDKHDISHEKSKHVRNDHSGQSSKIGIDKGETENINNASGFDLGNQSAIEFRVKPSYLENQQLKITTGDIIYGKQKANIPNIRTPEQISNYDHEHEGKEKSQEKEFNNHTQIKANLNQERKTIDENLENGLKDIIEKIMSAKPFEPGHKITPIPEEKPSTENGNVRNNVHNKKLVEVTTEVVAKSLERVTKSSTETHRPIQHPHKMVTISLGINITDPNLMNGEKYGTNRAIIMKSQIANISSIDATRVANPATNLISTFTNHLQNDLLFENMKEEIIVRPEININNNGINLRDKSVRDATKFTIDEVKANPYSSPIQRNHSNEYEWKPLDKSRNDKETDISSLLGVLTSKRLGKQRKEQEPITLLNGGYELQSVFVGNVGKEHSITNDSQKNPDESSKDYDAALLVRNGQTNRLKGESKPITVQEDIKEHPSTRGQSNMKPFTGRPWLRVAVRL